jgi:hypothetical protein
MLLVVVYNMLQANVAMVSTRMPEIISFSTSTPLDGLYTNLAISAARARWYEVSKVGPDNGVWSNVPPESINF